MNKIEERFKGAEWYKAIKRTNIHIVGAGGIGSWTTLALARAGAMIYLQDDDIVEDVNLAGQFYNFSDIGKSKVVAVAENVTALKPDVVLNYEKHRCSGHICGDIIIAAVDNMKTRKNIAQNAINRNKVFVDARLGFSNYDIFFMKSISEIEHYLKHDMFEDEEAQEATCTMKQTTYLAMNIGSKITELIINHISNNVFEEEIFKIPYKIEYCSKRGISKKSFINKN